MYAGQHGRGQIAATRCRRRENIQSRARLRRVWRHVVLHLISGVARKGAAVESRATSPRPESRSIGAQGSTDLFSGRREVPGAPEVWCSRSLEEIWEEVDQLLARSFLGSAWRWSGLLVLVEVPDHPRGVAAS